MTDPDERLGEPIVSLWTARAAVLEELEPLQEVQGPRNAREALLHLYGWVGNLVTATDALLLRLSARGAPFSQIEIVEALADIFWSTRKRIATMLQSSREQAWPGQYTMSTTYGEMIDTLREAQQVLRFEFPHFALARRSDSEDLVRLGESVRNLAEQTDSLLVLMTDHGAADALVEVAEELFNFFQETEEQIEALLETS